MASLQATFHEWASTADAVRATTKRLEKSAVLESYFRALDDDSLAIAARFFSGTIFPRHDMRTTQVGGSIIWGALAEITGANEEALVERYLAHGDSGDLAGELLATRPSCGVTLLEIEACLSTFAAAAGSNARRGLMRDLLGRLGGLEARFLIKLIGGELRIGLKEAQVEEALAKTFGRTLAEVRRANLLRGDIGEVAIYARRGTLDDAVLALFHPIGFMLAQPLASADEIIEALPLPFAVEDKYDGIRAQAHIGDGQVRLYSRTLDEITHGYPEVVAALAGLADGAVLDGELLAYDPAEPSRALPFKDFQRRLGRKKPSAAMQAEVPVMFVAYDILAADRHLVIDESYAARRRRVEALPWPLEGAARLAAKPAPSRLISSAAEVEAAFASARAAGNEGLIAKDPASVYSPGRRGKAWIKLKKALATLDVVVTGVERGHGRRRAVLSDYTFAVRTSESDSTLLNVGKAYNGLTDAEISEYTKVFEELTLERFGGFHRVRPEIVLEVTFDIVQRSARHKAGYALRFPRIVRIRDDKPIEEIDTLARVRELAGDAPAEAASEVGET